MQIVPLENEAQLNDLSSSNDYQVILKHNTTCPISKGVLERLQDNNATVEGVNEIHVLDLLSNRELSNAIADRFGVQHQSPQVLLIKNGQCTYNEWGFDISSEEISKAISNESGA